jgi:protein-glutamine gamma-glutamyltransferase
MTFAEYFKTSSYCLIGSGFLAIATGGRMGWIAITLFTAVFICSWFLDTARIQRSIPTWIWNCIGIAYIPLCLTDFGLFTRSFLHTILHILLFTAAVKLLTLSKDRDYLLLYLISFAELLAASTLTVSIVFILCFLAFLFSGICTLILFEMRRTNAKMQNETRVQPLVVSRRLRGTGLELFSTFPSKLLTAMAVGITILILGAAVPIFFLLPRTTMGMNKRPFGNLLLTSGFSDRVELGQIGSIKQSDAVVMRVKTDKSPSELPFDLKWRGLAFDYYDGRSWTRTDRIRRAIPVQGWYYKIENSIQGTNLVRQTFFIEALSTNVVFATHKALAISRDVGSLWRDSSESLYTSGHSMVKLRYSAVSDPIRPDPRNLSDLHPIAPDIVAAYTQTPPEDPRVAELARQIAGAARDRYSKALAIEKFLQTHYSYSLVLRGTPNSRDPLAMFLFDVREGHCEYFATAMAIMLRQLGIPSRLVNGFRMGEYNTLGNNWIVRQYDAHSWVEAYFPPYGWIEFDPTPPDPAYSKSAFLRALSNLADAIDLWWWEGVVNYDLSKQYSVISALRAGVDSLQHKIGVLAEFIAERIRIGIALMRSPEMGSRLISNWILWLPWLIPLVLLTIRPLRTRILSLVRRTLSRGKPKNASATFYIEALALLGEHGMKRGYAQTPMEFARSLGDHPAGAPFLSLTQMYNEIRFGPLRDFPSQTEAKALLHSLQAALTNQPQ